jgi:hypothetical protein
VSGDTHPGAARGRPIGVIESRTARPLYCDTCGARFFTHRYIDLIGRACRRLPCPGRLDIFPPSAAEPPAEDSARATRMVGLEMGDDGIEPPTITV